MKRSSSRSAVDAAIAGLLRVYLSTTSKAATSSTTESSGRRESASTEEKPKRASSKSSASSATPEKATHATCPTTTDSSRSSRTRRQRTQKLARFNFRAFEFPIRPRQTALLKCIQRNPGLSPTQLALKFWPLRHDHTTASLLAGKVRKLIQLKCVRMRFPYGTYYLTPLGHDLCERYKEDYPSPD